MRFNHLAQKSIYIKSELFLNAFDKVYLLENNNIKMFIRKGECHFLLFFLFFESSYLCLHFCFFCFHLPFKYCNALAITNELRKMSKRSKAKNQIIYAFLNSNLYLYMVNEKYFYYVCRIMSQMENVFLIFFHDDCWGFGEMKLA